MYSFSLETTITRGFSFYSKPPNGPTATDIQEASNHLRGSKTVGHLDLVDAYAAFGRINSHRCVFNGRVDEKRMERGWKRCDVSSCLERCFSHVCSMVVLLEIHILLVRCCLVNLLSYFSAWVDCTRRMLCFHFLFCLDERSRNSYRSTHVQRWTQRKSTTGSAMPDTCAGQSNSVAGRSTAEQKEKL